ncbi:UPF0149 family protein [Oleiagrimonas sp. C23AA]|uniref:UPF0149 family protein n=1 Tax=Oleiagrimonas sp. C23AA TaxID=2719047 RepID=UPI00141DFFD5|nr:UPF0149 family protein [Oleiagrimonas sp. C23AA]NII09776.1 UPF0149 family protein [Oleiagrimonas sp. C23AA]
MSEQAFSHGELREALEKVRLGPSASELHGSMTGFLSAGGRAETARLLDALKLESDDTQAPALLSRLYRDCMVQLDDPQLAFEPLLPGDEASLDARADALVEWCRGFLGGFGLAGVEAKRLSEDSQEMLRDLATIASSQLDHGDSEEDEQAFAEVSEFVRVGAMLLHAEMTRPAAQGNTTVH